MVRYFLISLLVGSVSLGCDQDDSVPDPSPLPDTGLATEDSGSQPQLLDEVHLPSTHQLMVECRFSGFTLP